MGEVSNQKIDIYIYKNAHIDTYSSFQSTNQHQYAIKDLVNDYLFHQ